MGSDEHSWGYDGAGQISHAGQLVDWGEKVRASPHDLLRRFSLTRRQFEPGDVVSSTLDLAARSISFAKNGRSLGAAFSGLSSSLRLAHMYPAVALKVRGCCRAMIWCCVCS